MRLSKEDIDLLKSAASELPVWGHVESKRFRLFEKDGLVTLRQPGSDEKRRPFFYVNLTDKGFKRIMKRK